MLSENLKSVLDGKLWRTAERLIRHYQALGYKIQQLSSVDPVYKYKPHIVCTKGYETIAIEIRERCNIERPFETFVTGCQAKRVAAKIYFAVPELVDEEETIVSHAQRNALKELGIGLLNVRETEVIEDIGTISCHRKFVIEPGSSLGKYSKEVNDIINKYNAGQCLDAVRDLCEEVEDATVALAIKAIKKGKLNLTIQEINDHEVDWAAIIDCLSIRVYKTVNQTQIITDKKLRASLHNFRDKRNLSDHRKTAKQLRDLEQQYPEAMLQGIRLLRELVRLNNNLR